MTHVYLIEAGVYDAEIGGIFTSIEKAKEAAVPVVNRLIAEESEYVKQHPRSAEFPYRAPADEWDGETYIDDWTAYYDDNRQCRAWRYTGHTNALDATIIPVRIFEYELDKPRGESEGTK
jgi:hypothetical protein